MKYDIYRQFPKPNLISTGPVSFSKDGSVLAMDESGKSITGSMVRGRVEWAEADGIYITGFEETGFDKHGRPKHKYQEWFCRYPKTLP